MKSIDEKEQEKIQMAKNLDNEIKIIHDFMKVDEKGKNKGHRDSARSLSRNSDQK